MTVETLSQHDEEKERHEHDFEENEAHHETSQERHDEHKKHEAEYGDEGFKEKGDRRAEDVDMSELKEAINTELRDEE